MRLLFKLLLKVVKPNIAIDQVMWCESLVLNSLVYVYVLVYPVFETSILVNKVDWILIIDEIIPHGIVDVIILDVWIL